MTRIILYFYNNAIIILTIILNSLPVQRIGFEHDPDILAGK
jgi:hypothetical protein